MSEGTDDDEATWVVNGLSMSTVSSLALLALCSIAHGIVAGPVAALASPAVVVYAGAAPGGAGAAPGGAGAAHEAGIVVVEREEALPNDGRLFGRVGGEVDSDQQRERAPGDGL